MMFGWHGPWMFGFGGVGMLFWLVLIVAVGYLVYRLSRNATGTSNGNNERSAMDSLQERYARGEIDIDTYNRMKDQLR